MDDEFDYESLDQKDGPVTLTPSESDYILPLLEVLRDENVHPDDSDVIVNIINKLNQNDSLLKLAPRETDYLLFLLRGIMEMSAPSDDSDTIASIINKLDCSRAQG